MKIEVKGNYPVILENDVLVSSSQQVYEVEFLLTPDWDSFVEKKAVFQANENVFFSEIQNGKTIIPKEALSVYGTHLYIGLYGVSEHYIYPTTYVDAGIILQGTEE